MRCIGLPFFSKRKVDFALIRESANETVQRLRTSSEDAAESFDTFIKEGKKAPGYARTVMQVAKNDNFSLRTTEYLDHKIDDVEYSKQTKNVNDGLRELFANNKNVEKFEKAEQKMYPKTLEARKNILTWFGTTSNHMYNTSRLKKLKSGWIKELILNKVNNL